VSYALLLAAKARRGVAELPIEVQEVVYDRLDVFAGAPELVRPRKGALSMVDDPIVLVGSVKYNLFLSVMVDHEARRLTLVRIGHSVTRNAD
jgi:hypothetical protein